MRYLLFLLLIPFPLFAEESPFGNPSEYGVKAGHSPFVSTQSLEQFIAEHNAKNSRPHYSRGPDLTDWFILNQAYSAPYDSEAPIVIYHAKDPFDAAVFGLQNSLRQPAPGSPSPKIIYEIGRNGRR